jgi:hypothetical protein
LKILLIVFKTRGICRSNAVIAANEAIAHTGLWLRCIGDCFVPTNDESYCIGDCGVPTNDGHGEACLVPKGPDFHNRRLRYAYLRWDICSTTA